MFKLGLNVYGQNYVPHSVLKFPKAQPCFCGHCNNSISANNLNVYYYIRHLLTELPQLIDKNGNIEQSLLEPLMPWSKSLPADCYSKRRN